MTVMTTDHVADISRHSRGENILGVLTGTLLASLGVYLLHSAHAVTGGTAGLALLLTYALPWSFSTVFLVINLPFFVLAWRRKGPSFTVRSIVAVVLLSGFAHVNALEIGPLHAVLPYAVVAGNLLAGVGLLILFRHGSSLGGFTIVALLAQERLGWRAGYVQMVLDVSVVLASVLVVPLTHLAWSAVGAVLLNLVLALNHRPGRYLAH